MAIGRAVSVQDRTGRVYRIPIAPERVEDELERFRRAVELTRDGIQEVAATVEGELSAELAAIFEAHRLLLTDRQFLDRVEERIRQKGVNAEWAVSRVTAELGERFRASESAQLADRVEDLEDVSRGLVRSLQGLDFHEVSELEGDIVLVAADVTPSEAIRLGRQGVVAFAVEGGGVTSHTTIIARSLGLPMVGGLERVTELVTDDDPIIVDGDAGVIILHPSASTLRSFERRCSAVREREEDREATRDLPAVTRDGTEVALLANIDLEEEIADAQRLGAAGIGLYRSEFLYIERSPELPSEEEQLAIYRRLIETFAPGPVTIRTYDLGGRKLAEELLAVAGDNPALGLRGVRLTLARPELFKPQLRALFRAGAAGDLRLMLPMVSSLEEVQRFRELSGQVVAELRSEGVSVRADLPVGIMIEVPAAAMISDRLAREVDFLAIGTNDLTQYGLAVDRNNDQVSGLFRSLHPGILRLMESVVRAARAARIEVSICGELAADPLATPLLLGLGLRQLSLGPRGLPEVKTRLRALEIDRCEALAVRALDATELQVDTSSRQPA